MIKKNEGKSMQIKYDKIASRRIINGNLRF